MSELIAKNMCKEIKGKTLLSDINLQLQSGKIYCFSGKNGSGKTMLLRTLCGLIKPSSGKIFLDGKELYKDIDRLGTIGVLIENAGLYPEFTGYENLSFFSKVQKLIGPEDIRNAIRRVGLEPDDRRTFKKYSLGMKQRILIAQAIMEKPDFLFLDEPTNALDEQGTELIRGLIREEAERGTMILLASHEKEEMNVLADEMFQMENGRIL